MGINRKTKLISSFIFAIPKKVHSLTEEFFLAQRNEEMA